mmetsp:Transcript_77324/g.223729  ORF Transcript_77324/g.223729 Transcript_77324/m.223729 type:complete len:256 (+) Transcript_77324:416-1183(+)
MTRVGIGLRCASRGKTRSGSNESFKDLVEELVREDSISKRPALAFTAKRLLSRVADDLSLGNMVPAVRVAKEVMDSDLFGVGALLHVPRSFATSTAFSNVNNAPLPFVCGSRQFRRTGPPNAPPLCEKPANTRRCRRASLPMSVTGGSGAPRPFRRWCPGRMTSSESVALTALGMTSRLLQHVERNGFQNSVCRAMSSKTSAVPGRGVSALTSSSHSSLKPSLFSSSPESGNFSFGSSSWSCSWAWAWTPLGSVL